MVSFDFISKVADSDPDFRLSHFGKNMFLNQTKMKLDCNFTIKDYSFVKLYCIKQINRCIKKKEYEQYNTL